ncbi:MAG: hypothetical protein JNL41_15605 [Phenylobacterium sp.]|uniref:hypothetical protein n=1 Tax=Phenylobacterium sp. TaxID=1871053 RepID=UPI001A441A58|nr:hypothetical protein [Phenylobacterium sp.]MBL8555699.1 hypothetical protein [Phenylobacterium sp.]
MNLGLSHIGTTPRAAASALTPAARAPAAAVATDLATAVTAVKPVVAVSSAAAARQQTRDQVMAEQGIDQLGLFRMSSQDRIRAETSILVEAARRDLAAGNQRRAEIRPNGNFLDLRI